MRRLILALALTLLPCMALAQTATATVGVSFSDQLAAPTAAGYLYTTNGTDNKLPPGLTYSNSTGVLSGTPTAAGTYSILLQQATAAAGVYIKSTLTLTVSAAGTTVPPPPPPAVVLLCANSPKPNCGVNLSWSAPTSTADAVKGYLLFRATAPSSAFKQLTPIQTSALTYIDANVAVSTTYDYYVVSVDAQGVQSVPSNTASVSVPAPIVIPPPPPVVPDPPTNLTATLVMNDGSAGN